MIVKDNVAAFDIFGDMIYYSDSSNNTIYRIKADGTEKNEVRKIGADYLQISGDWIYISSDDYGIYKLKLDGTDGFYLIRKGWMDHRFIISGDWIYYADDTGMSKIKTDGTENKKLFDVENGVGKILSIKNNRIYYETIIAEGPDYYGWVSSFYNIKLDGTDKQTLSEGTFKSWAVVDGTVYYNKIIRDINIIMTKLDGTGRQVLVPDLEWH